MDLWEQLNKEAVRLFNSGKYFVAKMKFKVLFERALYLFNATSDKLNTSDKMVVSLQKLSECYIQVGDFDNAAGVIFKGHQFFNTLIEINRINSHKTALLKMGQSKLKSYLLFMIEKYPEVKLCRHCQLSLFGYCVETANEAYQ